MRVIFNKETKLIDFVSGLNINANDVGWQTLEVECVPPLGIGESLWVVFFKGDAPEIDKVEAGTHDILLAQHGGSDYYSEYFPTEVLASPGTWKFQLFARTFNSGEMATQYASEIETFYVSDKLKVDDANNPVNNYTVVEAYLGALEAKEQAEQLLQDANASITFTPNVESVETVEYGQPAVVTIENRVGEGSQRFLDFSFKIPEGKRGEQGPQGPTGPQGPQGPQGPKGEGFKISKTYTSVEAMHNGYGTDDVPLYGLVLIDTGNVNDADNAKLFVKGDTEYTLLTDLSGTQGIKGEDGKDGKDGEDGKSAYQIWLDNGNTGTETKFLDSLKGKDGKDGVDGKDGKDGTDGVDGVNGKDGKSAYEIWLDEGNNGTEQDFLDSLKPEGVDEDAVKDIINEGDHTFQKPVKVAGVDIEYGEIETTYTATGIEVWHKNQNVMYSLAFPVEDGTLATQEWVKENGVGGGQLPENVVTDVTVNGTSVVDVVDGERIANIVFTPIKTEYVEVTEEDGDDYVWSQVWVGAKSYQAICVLPDSKLANVQKIYNANGEEIVFQLGTVVIDDSPRIGYAIGEGKGSYKLEITTGMTTGGSGGGEPGEPSVILTVKYTSQPILLRNLEDVTFIDWGDGRTTTAENNETEFAHVYVLEQNPDVWFEIRIYGCTEIGDDAFNMIDLANDGGNYAIQSITVKSDVRKIGKNIVHTVYPVTVIMDRLVPPKIADVAYLVNAPVGTNPGITSFPANVTEIVVPNEEVVERYTKYWKSFYTSIIKAPIIDKQKWYRLSGTVEIYDANSVKATSFGIQAVAKNFTSLSGAGIPLLTSLLSDTVGMVSFSMYSGNDFAPISIRSDFVGVSGINILTNEFVYYGSDYKLYLVNFTEEEI